MDTDSYFVYLTIITSYVIIIIIMNNNVYWYMLYFYIYGGVLITMTNRWVINSHHSDIYYHCN